MSREAPRLSVLMTVDAVGGVWRYAMDLAGGLAEEGVAVVFAGFGPPPSAAQRQEARRIGLLEWQDAPLDWLARGPQELEPVPGLIAAVARRHRVDVLHLNAPSQAAGLSVPVPVVAVSHSCIPTWFNTMRGNGLPPDWLWHRRLNRIGLMAANAVLTPSQAQARLMAEAYGPLPELRVVPNASSFAPPPATAPRERFVLAAGRWWDEGKNAAVLDAAAETITAPVVLAGATVSPEGDRVPLPRCDLRGSLPPEALAGLMQRAAVFVAPSLYEPFGLAVLEAARARLPLVLADIPTFRELWQDAAVFFPPRDAEALSLLVNGLLDDPSRCRRLGEAAERASRRFTLQAQTAATRALYAELCPLSELQS